MKAVILSGGYGRRLGNITRFTPKSLIKINNKTLLEWQIIQLKKFGISEFFLNTHFFHNQFKKIIKKLSYLRVKINLKYQKKLNGTAGAVKIFEKKLIREKFFLVIYGDILFSENIRELLNFHKSRNSLCSIYVHERNFSNSIINYSKFDGKIISFYERPSIAQREKLLYRKNNNFGVNSGIYLMNSSLLKKIPCNKFSDFPDNIFPELVRRNKIFALKIKKDRFALDSNKRLIQAKMKFNFKRILNRTR